MSSIVRSSPPSTYKITLVALSIVADAIGQFIAYLTASMHFSFPLPMPIPKKVFFDSFNAKTVSSNSKLMTAGIVIGSTIVFNASITISSDSFITSDMGAFSGRHEVAFSQGIMSVILAFSLSACIPLSAFLSRFSPSNTNGVTTIATAIILFSLAISAIIDGTADPMPPPMPATTTIKSAPLTESNIRSLFAIAVF